MILAKARQESREFYEVLDYYLNLIRQIHKRTYDYLGEMRASTNPLAYCEGGFYGGKLGMHDKIKPLLKAATASFGITALNELQQLYNKKSLVEDGAFALLVMEHINKRVIEFKEEDPLTIISVNGTNVVVNHKVYTINYDFKNDLVIKLSDGLNEITKTYKAEDLKNRLYVEDNKYYILKDDKIVTNNGQFTHKVIHIYENKALLSDGSVYNLDTKSLIGKQDNNIYTCFK